MILRNSNVTESIKFLNSVINHSDKKHREKREAKMHLEKQIQRKEYIKNKYFKLFPDLKVVEDPNSTKIVDYAFGLEIDYRLLSGFVHNKMWAVAQLFEFMGIDSESELLVHDIQLDLKNLIYLQNIIFSSFSKSINMEILFYKGTDLEYKKRMNEFKKTLK